MNIFDRLGRFLSGGGINAVSSASLTKDSAAWAEMFGAPGAVPLPTEKSALQVTAIYACVNLISGAIASMPMRVYRRTPDGQRDEITADPLWWILNEEFCPRWMAAAAWEFLVASLLLHGDAFAKIQRDGVGQIKGLVPIHPARVTVGVYPDGSRLVYAVEADPTIPQGQSGAPQREVIDQDDMLHVPGFGFDGIRGLSALRYSLSLSGGVALATQDYAARFFANSARPDYALVAPAGASPAAISQEKLEFIRAQLIERHQGVNKSHLPMVLTGGMEFRSITMPVKDLQLVEIRGFQIEEIGRAFGVPPFMIGHTEKTTSWGSGVESMGTGFVRYTLMKHLEKFQNEINRKFFRTASKVAEFDTFKLERADMKSLFDAFRVALGRPGEPGFMTTDEVRTLLNLKRKPGGDTLATGGQNAPQPAA